MAGWGEPEHISEGAGESLPNGGHIDLGGGHVLKLDAAAWRALLHRPEVVAAITRRAHEIAATANDMVEMDPRAVERLGEGQPAYDVSVQNDPHTTRPRARVEPANMLGVVDDAVHNTLYKALTQHQDGHQ